MKIINTFPRDVDFSSLRVFFGNKMFAWIFHGPASEQEDDLLRSLLTSRSYDLP